jgi:hypothetical protein
MMMDPLRLGGSQSRCRAYIVFVRADVHSARGPFAPASCYSVAGPSKSVRHLLDLSLPCCLNRLAPLSPGVQSTSCAALTSAVLSSCTPLLATPSAAVTPSTVRALRSRALRAIYIDDTRAGVCRIRCLSTAECSRVQGLPADCLHIDGVPPDAASARKYIGRGTESMCMKTVVATPSPTT